MLKTRHRERILFNACLTAKQPVAIDNTNPAIGDRQRYIPLAKEHRFTITGYYRINFNDLPTWQKRGSGLYWIEYQKTEYNPKEKHETIVKRQQIKQDLEIPMKDEYSKFIRDLIVEKQTR